MILTDLGEGQSGDSDKSQKGPRHQSSQTREILTNLEGWVRESDAREKGEEGKHGEF